MKDLLKFIINSIVDHPDQVEIEEEKGEGIVTFKLNLATEDMGRVIGKQGKIIKAIRTIVRIPAIKQGARVNIELLEKPDAKTTAVAIGSLGTKRTKPSPRRSRKPQTTA